MICNHHRDNGFQCSCLATYEAIVAGESIPKLDGFCAIVRAANEARRTDPDFLSMYASDLLVHDRAILTDYAGPFLWVLGASHTCLLRPSTERGALTVRGIVQAFGAPSKRERWFWFDGTTLRRVLFVEHAEHLVSEAIHGRHWTESAR